MSVDHERFAGSPECREILELLVPFLDGEVSPAEALRLEEHLAVCPSCSRALEAERRLGLELVRTATTPSRTFVDLARRAREAARASEARRPAWHPWAARAALAACALLAVGLWLFWAVGPVPPAPDPEDLIGSLEVLEALEAEGLEPSPELAQAVLELTEDQGIDGTADLPWEALLEENL